MHDTDALAVRSWLKANPGYGLTEIAVPGANASELAELASLGRLSGIILTSLRPHLADPRKMHAYCGYSDAVMNWFLGEGCPLPPQAVVASAHRVLVDNEEDGLAKLYSSIVDARRRRRLGTFFTPQHEVDRMTSAWVSLDKTPGSVVDVGAGVGIYTVSASRSWPTSDIFAVDVNPVTLGLLTLRLAADSSIQNVTPVQADFAKWLQANWEALPTPRLIIGNPPYTRMQLLPPADRAMLLDQAGGLVGRRASLASLMTAISVQALGPDDGICLLLPAQWLESDYAAGLRDWLWAAANRRLELRLFSSALFQDAAVDAVSLLVGPNLEQRQPMYLFVDGSPDRREGDRTTASPKRWRSLFPEIGNVTADRSRQKENIKFDPERQARRPTLTRIDAREHLTVPKATASSSHSVQRADQLGRHFEPRRRLRLGDLADIKRGIATGSNWFYVLDEKRRVELNLPLEVVRPLVRRLRAPHAVRKFDRIYPPASFSPALEHTTVAEVSWLLVTGAQPESETVLEYIRSGVAAGASSSYLCGRRTHWYDLEPLLREIHVAISPMSKDCFRILEVPEGMCILNNLYGLRWHDGVDARLQEKILQYLRDPEGQRQLREIARSQAGGLLKIEPATLQSLQVPVAIYTD